MKDIVVKMAEVFKALGDPTRLRIIRMLASNMLNDLCVADLAERLGITQPAASQHIRVLKNLGILEPNRKGFRVFYTINTEILTTYKEQIDALFELAFQKCEKFPNCGGHES
jgi:ArsR family transcriptional regulator